MNKSILIAGALAAASAVPAAAEVVEQGDDSFTTRDSAKVTASPRQAWIALIRPGEWWNDSHTWSGDASNMKLTPTAGGCFCEALPGDGDIPMDGSVQHAVVIQAFPDRALRLRGELGPLQAIPATGVLTITLVEVDGGTNITWEYRVGNVSGFEMDVISNAVDGVMSQQLNGLRDKLGAMEEPVDEADADAEPTAEEQPE